MPPNATEIPDHAKKLCKRLEAKSFSRDKSSVQLPVCDEFSQAVVAVGPPVAAPVKQVADLGEDAAPAPAKRVADPGGDAAPAPAKKRLAGHPRAASAGRSSKRSRHTAKP